MDYHIDYHWDFIIIGIIYHIDYGLSYIDYHWDYHNWLKAKNQLWITMGNTTLDIFGMIIVLLEIR